MFVIDWANYFFFIFIAGLPQDFIDGLEKVILQSLRYDSNNDRNVKELLPSLLNTRASCWNMNVYQTDHLLTIIFTIAMQKIPYCARWKTQMSNNKLENFYKYVFDTESFFVPFSV